MVFSIANALLLLSNLFSCISMIVVVSSGMNTSSYSECFGVLFVSSGMTSLLYDVLKLPLSQMRILLSDPLGVFTGFSNSSLNYPNVMVSFFFSSISFLSFSNFSSSSLYSSLNLSLYLISLS